jgi:assimilatory nitrate reductase catalytic subunit
MLKEVKTTCAYCGVGCGLIARVGDDGAVEIAGDADHPANYGRLCSKGAALGETVGLEGRLLQPLVDGAPADWDTALDRVAQGFADVIAEHGPDAVAFYVSGQLLTEDYYVANKLMKGFLGSANIDSNSRLCMSSAVAAHQRAFGSDTVPGNYEDFEAADLVVLAGSNTAWCHPVVYQRIAAAKESLPDMRVVVIDPRRTATCDIADLHLAVTPGSDAALFNGLLAHLAAEGLTDRDFVEAHTSGLDDALAAARAGGAAPGDVAERCGLDEGDVAEFFASFAGAEKTVTLFSQGIKQSTSGSDKGNAIINCHLLTGRIGRPGMGPFSITGQPNAMGGRDVGGLATQLAAHMDIENPDHRDLVGRFWRAQNPARQPGLKSLDLFDAVHDGRVKAIWIMATNPLVSMPDADRVKAALAGCDLVVLSDVTRDTDTAAVADIVLPALAWGEKDGTVTNSERRISRQRAFLPAPGAARADWWIICQVAKRLGYAEAFAYSSPLEIFREHASLSGFENHGGRDFDISGLADLDRAGYDNLAPVQWPVKVGPVKVGPVKVGPVKVGPVKVGPVKVGPVKVGPVKVGPVKASQAGGTPRMFANGRFFHPDGKARFIAVTPKAPAHAPDRDFPLALNTGRLRDHWHTMTRTGKSPRLSSCDIEPRLQIHPADAVEAGLTNGGLADVASRWGGAAVRVEVSSDQRPGSVFMPMHWNDQFATRARVGAVINPSADPLSGQPEFKHTPVRVTPRHYRWHAFALSRRALDFAEADYCVRSLGKGYSRYDLAGDVAPASWPAWSRAQLGAVLDEPERIEYADPASGQYRFAVLSQGRLEACLFVSPDYDLISPLWLAGLFDQDAVSPAERSSLLVGQPATGAADAGPVVCACFGVGIHTIRTAISSQALGTVDEIGTALRAGTKCGSCKPELSRLLQDAPAILH